MGSHVDCANLVPSSLEPITNQLVTRSHRLIRVLSADFSSVHIDIGAGWFWSLKTAGLHNLILRKGRNRGLGGVWGKDGGETG